MIMCFSPDQRISIDVNNILEVISSIIVISMQYFPHWAHKNSFSLIAANG